MFVLPSFELMAVCQKNSKTSAKDEEGRGMTRWERIAAMQVDSLYQRQYHVRALLKRRVRAGHTNKVF
jgi:hypothetical protein